MKILFTRFPLESHFSGAEVQTLSLMKGLREKSYAVAFLGSCPVLLKETANLHLPHAKLEIGPPPVTKWGAISFFWRRKRMQERLHAALHAFGSLDAIFMLSLSEKLFLTEAAIEKGIKVFWMEHDRVGRWLTKNPWLPKLRELSKSVTTVCVSELSRKIYLDLGWDPKKVVAIPNGIEVEKFGPGTPSTPLRAGGLGPGTHERLHLGCVARLSPEKGVDLLIQAVSGLPAVELTIVGMGPDEGYLRKLIDAIHTQEMLTHERIRITPHVEDLGTFYRSIDALVLPSCENDPFGLVAAEAMASGTPVIVTDQCGIAGYLRDGADVLVAEANSDKALREAISRVQDTDLRQRLSSMGRNAALEKFSLNSMIDSYEKLVKSLH